MGPAGGGKSRQMRDLAHYSTGIPTAFLPPRAGLRSAFPDSRFSPCAAAPEAYPRGEIPAGLVHFRNRLAPGRRRTVGGKKLVLVLLLLAAAGGGVYYWLHRVAPADQTASAQAPAPVQGAPQGESAAPQPRGSHPMPGETVAKEQPFFESDYGFSMVVPAGWRVVSWTDPAPAEAGKRRPAYKIRLEDPNTHALLDFACSPSSEKSRTAVEEIF